LSISTPSSARGHLTHTRLRGRLWLRLAIGNVLTTERHLAHTWELLRKAASAPELRAA
jgi:aromatic-L-amino-acid/L-tryptophan decarboxylase